MTVETSTLTRPVKLSEAQWQLVYSLRAKYFVTLLIAIVADTLTTHPRVPFCLLQRIRCVRKWLFRCHPIVPTSILHGRPYAPQILIRNRAVDIETYPPLLHIFCFKVISIFFTLDRGLDVLIWCINIKKYNRHLFGSCGAGVQLNVIVKPLNRRWLPTQTWLPYQCCWKRSILLSIINVSIYIWCLFFYFYNSSFSINLKIKILLLQV